MKVEEAGRRLAWYLDRGAQDLESDTLDQLKAAREKAMARVPVTQGELSLAGGSGARALTSGHGPAHGFGSPKAHLRMGIAAMVIIASMVAISYWQQNADPDPGFLDAQLLGGELPLHALTHEDFPTWLQEESR